MDQDDDQQESNKVREFIDRSRKRVAKAHRSKVNKVPKTQRKAGRPPAQQVGKVEFRYKRMPANKTRLITVDVIGQIIADYINKEELPTHKRFLNHYRSALNGYFDSLIDLQLSNNMILHELSAVTRAKNQCRSAIFDVREQHQECQVKLNELRSKYVAASEEYALKSKTYRGLLSLEEGTVAVDTNGLQRLNGRKVESVSRLLAKRKY